MHTVCPVVNPCAAVLPILRAVAHTYDKLDVLQREKVWELKQKGLSGTQVRDALAAGFPREDPPVTKVKITPQAVNQLYRRQRLERETLYSQRLAFVSTPDTLAVLRRKLSLIANAEADRLQAMQERGKLNPDQLRKLAGACERIEKLELSAAAREAEPAVPPPHDPSGDDDQEGEKAPSFADTLLDEAAKREAAQPRDPAPDAVIAAVDPERTVPDDLRAQDTATSTA